MCKRVVTREKNLCFCLFFFFFFGRGAFVRSCLCNLEKLPDLDNIVP